MTPAAILAPRHVPSGPDVRSTTERIVVELKPNLDLSAADAAAIRALVEQRPHVGIFVSPAWLSGFFAEPPEDVQPHLLLVREDGRLRAIAPLGIGRRGRQVCVTLLGGGAGSDRVDLLAARGFEATCADALFSWLVEVFGNGGFVLELRDVPADSALWGAMHRLDRSRLVALAPREIHAGPYLDLHEAGVPATPADLASSLEKHRRRFERRGRVSIDVLQDPAEALDAFEDMVRFLHARWDGHQNLSAMDDERRRRFHRCVIPLLLRDGLLRFVRFTVDGRPVAVVYGLTAGGWWGSYLVGYDREWATPRLQLGRLALGYSVDLAIQEGASQYDFLKGAERVKYLWPVHDRITVDADVYSGGTGPQLVRAVRATQEVAAALVGSARHLVSLPRSRTPIAPASPSLGARP